MPSEALGGSGRVATRAAAGDRGVRMIGERVVRCLVDAMVYRRHPAHPCVQTISTDVRVDMFVDRCQEVLDR